MANDSLAPVNEQYLIGFNTEYKPENDPFYPRFWPERLRDLSKRKQQLMDGEPKPMGVFACDMADLFGVGVPEEWTRQIMDAIWDNDEYDRFYLLTKQPQNLTRFSQFPDNCWVGVTATDTDRMLNATRYLSEFSAKIKYISFEPLLDWFNRDVKDLTLKALQYGRINWVIIGAQTKPYKPPKIEWVWEIVHAADKAGIPVFLKDNLMPLMTELSIPDLAWYADLWRKHNHTIYVKELRQEIPK